MALNRLKLAIGLALAVGVAATLWSGGPRDSRVLAAQEPPENPAGGGRGTRGSTGRARAGGTPAEIRADAAGESVRSQLADLSGPKPADRGRDRGTSADPGGHGRLRSPRRGSQRFTRQGSEVGTRPRTGSRATSTARGAGAGRGALRQGMGPQRPARARRRRAGAGLQRDLVRGLPRPGRPRRRRARDQERRPRHGDAQRLRPILRPGPGPARLTQLAQRRPPSLFDRPRVHGVAKPPLQSPGKRPAEGGGEPRQGSGREPDQRPPRTDDAGSPDAQPIAPAVRRR